MTTIRIDVHHHLHFAATPGVAEAIDRLAKELHMRMDELIAAFKAEAERDANATTAMTTLFNRTLERISQAVPADAPQELVDVLASFRANTDTLVAAAIAGTPADPTTPVADPAPADPAADAPAVDPATPVDPI